MKKLLLIPALFYYSISAQCQCSLPLITDFECTAPSVGSYPSTLTTVTNPSSTGINTSANVGRYVDDGTQGWDALVFDFGSPIDLSTNNILKIKLYSPSSIQILAKLEGGTANREVWSDFSINEGPLNSWIEFNFDFSGYNNNSSSGGDMNTKIVLFFNANVTTGTTTDTYHIDDIRLDSTVLSNEEFSENVVKMHPNPVIHQININSLQVINGYELIDITGKVIARNRVDQQQKFSIDVQTLVGGTYFLRLRSNYSIEIIPFIKH